MSQWVSNKEKRDARRADLYGFLLSRHPEAVQREGDSLRLLCDHSVSVKRGYCGYMDFSNGETGNSVDCLVDFLDYEFQDAVAALCGYGITVPEAEQDSSTVAVQQPVPGEGHRQEPEEDLQEGFVLPAPAPGPYKQLYAYLTQVRMIPPAMVRMLIGDKVLYQEAEHANMVFVNPEKTFAELRGSNSYRTFHQVRFDQAAPEAFWWFKPKGLLSNPDRAYVCEGAIDAISLYLKLVMEAGNEAEDGLYCSIGGVANQHRIDAIKAGMAAAGCPTIIAVDRDAAGEACRQRNQDCCAIIPQRKDWNEDMVSYMNSHPEAMDSLGRAVDMKRNPGKP